MCSSHVQKGWGGWVGFAVCSITPCMRTHLNSHPPIHPFINLPTHLPAAAAVGGPGRASPASCCCLCRLVGWLGGWVGGWMTVMRRRRSRWGRRGRLWLACAPPPPPVRHPGMERAFFSSLSSSSSSVWVRGAACIHRRRARGHGRNHQTGRQRTADTAHINNHATQSTTHHTQTPQHAPPSATPRVTNLPPPGPGQRLRFGFLPASSGHHRFDSTSPPTHPPLPTLPRRKHGPEPQSLPAQRPRRWWWWWWWWWWTLL